MNNRKFPIYLFYILFFLTIIDINRGSSIVSMISYVLILLIAIICREEIGVTLLFGLFPLQRVFMISKGFMTVVPLISILIIIKCFRHYRVFRRCEKQLAAVIILFVYSLIVEFIRFSSIGNTINYILTVILMIVICEIVNKELRKSCMIVYCVSSIFSAMVGYLFPSVSRFTALFTMEYNPRFQGLLADPGEFGQTMMCAVAMIITLFVINRQQKGLKEVEKVRKGFQVINAIIFCIIFLYFAILSGTRACLIAIAIIYIAVLVRLFQTKRKSTQIIALLIGVISIFALSSIGTMLFDVVSATHGGESLSEDIRLSIWSGYMQSIRNNLDVVLFGVGMNSCGMYGGKMGLGNPHNIIIEKIVECGIIGFVLNFFIFYPMIQRKRMSFKTPETLPFYVLLSTLMVYGSSGLDLPYLLLALIIERREDDENEDYESVSHDKKSGYAIY